LFSSEDEPLLIWWDPLFVLNLGLDIFNRIRGLDVERNRFSSQGLDKDLHVRFNDRSDHLYQI